MNSIHLILNVCAHKCVNHISNGLVGKNVQKVDSETHFLNIISEMGIQIVMCKCKTCVQWVCENYIKYYI